MLLTYTGEPDRYYPTLGLTPTPGQDYDLAAHPRDGRWQPEPAPPPEPEPAGEDATGPDAGPQAAAEDEPVAPARRRTRKESPDA